MRKKKMGKRQDKGDKCEMEDKTGKEGKRRKCSKFETEEKKDEVEKYKGRR